MQQNLPQGFISVQEAIKLIESDKYDDAKVDTAYLVSHLAWIEVAHNFRIPRLEHVKDKNGNIKLVERKSTYVEIRTALEAELLKDAITKHYRSIVKHDYVAPTTKNFSNIYDEEDGSNIKRRRNKKPIAEEGQDISGEHDVQTINGDK